MKKCPSPRYWLTLICCCGLTASSIGILTNSVGVFYSPVATSLQVGRGAFATHATLSILMTAFMSPVAAKLLGKVPLRLYLGLGMILSVGATALMAFSHELWAFYILGIVKGAGITFFGVLPVTAVISNWFYKSYGLAVGITLSFSGLSGAIFSPLFSSIIVSAGWQAAYLCMAAFSLVLALPGVLTLREDPQSLSLPPYGGAPGNITLPEQTAHKKMKLSFLALLLTCTFSITLCAVTSLGQYFPTMAEAAGMAAQVGAMMVSAGMVGNIVSKLVIGIVSDHKGPFFANGCMVAINIVAMFVLLRLPAEIPAVAIVTAFFYGAVYSVGGAGIPLLTRGVFGMEGYTSAYSIVQVFANGGAALAMTVIGLVYDLTGSCNPVLVCSLAIQAVNLCLLVVLSRMRRRGALVQAR